MNSRVCCRCGGIRALTSSNIEVRRTLLSLKQPGSEGVCLRVFACKLVPSTCTLAAHYTRQTPV
eukprot:1053-Heterococcus_DN1.PRE.3